MTSIDIVNMALADCGGNLISVIGEDTAEGRQAKAKYAGLRDLVLEAREWTFAKGRLLLNRDPIAPAFGYTYQYIIPPAVIRVIRVYNSSGTVAGSQVLVDDWVREGARVLTDDAGPLAAEVILRVDESTFSPGMAVALAARLTASFAIPLTENRQLAKDFMDYYKAFMQDAGAMDGSQGRTQVLRPPPLPGRRSRL